MPKPVLSLSEGIAAIGRRHFVGGFASVGARTLACEAPEGLADAVAPLLEGEPPTLVLLDQHFASCEETIRLLRKRGSVVVLLPAQPTEGHPALDEMRTLIELAAGANILGEY